MTEHVAGTIAALVWDDFDGRGAKATAMLLTSYLITRWSDGQFEICVSAPGYSTGFDGERFRPTLEAAKAAAQADFNQRIRSAILPAQGQDEPVAWLCRDRIMEQDSVTLDRDFAKYRAKYGDAWLISPLYAHPAPAVSLPEDVAGLCMALRSGEQADMDGCRVKVSRQACEQGADTIEAQAVEVARLTGALSDTIKKWSKSQDAQIDALDRLEQAEAEVARLRDENAELHRRLGGGCDANNGGYHNLQKQGRYAFCGDCGETLKGVRFNHAPRAALSPADSKEG